MFSAVVPPCWSACFRFWRGRQSVVAKYWKFMLGFVCSQLGAGQGNTALLTRIICYVSVEHQVLYKS